MKKLHWGKGLVLGAFGWMRCLALADRPSSDITKGITRSPHQLLSSLRAGWAWQALCAAALQLILLMPGVAQAATPMIAAGAKHTCSLSSSGGVKCWGDNTNGQLGDGSTSTRVTPVTVSTLSSGVIAIAAGANHTCAVTSAGAVKCWGSNISGQLGDNSTTTRMTPTAVSGLSSGVSGISAGFGHSCALTTGGGVKCWGLDNFGQLGDNSSGTNRLTPVDVSGMSSGVNALAAGNGHTCALTSGAGVKCWGDNFYGQLGDGSTTQRLTPWDVSGLASGVSAIAAGNGYTCAVTTGGGVKCWGLNNLSQLGDGGTTNRLSPWDVSGLSSGVSAVVASATHTCALTTGGTAKCWGYNPFGQLGDNSTTNRVTPVDVSGITGEANMITAGDDHSCVMTLSGGVKCWGKNDIGQLGDGGYNTTSHLTPWDVNGLATGVSGIAAGNGYTCAVTTGGGAKCWGTNSSGQLGDGSITLRRTPTDVSGLPSGVSTIMASEAHTCALTISGAVKCWGNNGSGQLGDGTTTQRLTPTDVTGLTSGVNAIAVGSNHSCALTSLGGVKCWGSNAYGQLGDGTRTPRSTLVDVSGLTSGVIAVAAGGNSSCALTNVGGVKCWGYNPYGLGDGTSEQRLTPVDVSGLTSGVSAIAVSGIHTCALIRGAGPKCWGLNSYGQLGDGGRTQRSTPVDVSGLTSGVSAIAAGSQHSYYADTCALTTAGGMKCWGYNGDGRLGDGSDTQSWTPVDVNGLTSGVSAIAVGASHTCALTSSSGMKCWGDNSSLQLGDGTATVRPYASLFVVGLVLIDNPTLIAATNPSTTDQNVNFTATVTGISPVGTVTFNFGDGSTTQTVTLAGGQAAQSHSFSTPGSYTVTAAYSGDNYNVPGTSAALIQSVVTVPGAPTITAATAGNGSATLTFNAPSSNGGATISGYKASCGTTTVASANSPITIAPLNNGTPYSCTVVASNIMGDSAPSAAASLTPAAPPDAPTLVNATAGNGQATITFTAPVNNGGGAITGYAVTSNPAGGTDSNGGSTGLSHVVIGLVNGSAYTFTVKATSSGGTGAASTVSNSVTPKGNQTIGVISFLPSSLKVGGNSTAMTTATSGLAVSFRSTTTGVCTVTGNMVTGVTAGTCNIAVNQSGNGTYNAAPQVTQNIIVAKASQTIGAITFLPNSLTVDGNTTISATATSSLAVSFSSTTLSVCTISGSTVTGVTAGTCTIAANQAGNDNYNEATQVTQNITVKAAQTIGTISLNPSTFVVGGTATASATATSGLAVTFSSSATPTICAVSGRTVSALAAGTCTITADQAGNTTYSAAPQITQNITVNKASQTIGAISFSPTTLILGGTSTASAIATSGLGVIFSSTTLGTCTVSGRTVTGITAGICTIAADQAGNATYSAAPQVTQNITVSATSTRLINLSTRGQVQTGDNVMIGGFIIGGSTPKKVLVRAVGPNLANYGVSGVLLDPSLQLFSGQTAIASNDDWGSATNMAEIQASGFAPVNGKESAILSTLNPGAYTAIVSGMGGGTGVGIVEVYELDQPEIPLINISTRGKVLTGDNVMIGGFIIQGDSAKTVLIRAVGPNLANYGVTGVLANPKLQLYSGQTVIASNDDWGTATNASAITATGLAPVNPLESAILINLQPGAYTAIVSGADGGSGVGIVEVFAQ